MHDGSDIYTIFAWSSDAYGNGQNFYEGIGYYRSQKILQIGSDRPQDCLDVFYYDDNLSANIWPHNINPPVEETISHVVTSTTNLNQSEVGFFWI